MAGLRFGRYDYAAFLTFLGYAACSTALPLVLIPLAVSLNFPLNAGGMGQGGALQLGRSVPMVLSMLFCGFAAARWGKRRSLGVAVLMMGVGIMFAGISPGYALLFAAVGLAGLGEGVIEGLATPLVQDIHPEEPGRYINFSHSFWSVGVVITTLSVGALLSFGVNWRGIVVAIGLLACLPALLLLGPARGYRGICPDRGPKISATRVWRHFGDVVSRPRFWLFFVAMFLAGGAEFCLTFWCPTFIRMAFNGSAWDAGAGTAIFAVGMIFGRMGSGWVVRQHRLYHLVQICACAATAVSLLLPMIDSLCFLMFALFLLGIAIGPFWPSIQSYCVDRVTADSTMIFILLSCAGVPGCGFFSWLMGALGDVLIRVHGPSLGFKLTFYLVPLCAALIVGLLAIDRKWGGAQPQK